MNRKGWVSAAVLMALGAGHQAVTPGSSSTKQGQIATPAPPAQSESADLCNALQTHFSFPLSVKDPAKGPCLPVTEDILFVIATAPSPTNSQLALSFDRTIEAIQRAAGDRGFLFDRFVFPWDAEPHRQTDPDKKRAEEKRRRDSEAKPGLLLFRGHFDESDPMHTFKSLGVLLVPENPSSGVNGEAFVAAAEFAQANSTREGFVLVLGPSFSSSAVSLHNAIHRTKLSYRIRSGSATVPEAWLLLNGQYSDDFHPFRATVRDDDQATEALFKHLDTTGEWHKEGRIAILSESGTLYGAHATLSNARSKRLNLVFPRGISWLRNAYQDMPASAGPPALPAGIPAPVAKLLPFAISEPTYGDDKPPSLSATQTPLSEEAALVSIANTLRHERVRFVVLTSTDPLDNIFLIRFLRAHCPDLRIITFESDLLYVRAASEFPATGVVLVTTYPLFTQNQEWTSYGVSADRVPFVSMASEGTYNALRSLLLEAACRPSEVGDQLVQAACGWPEGGDRPLDYGIPFQPGTRVPPVWLTVTTPTGYWPLAVVGDDAPTQKGKLKPSEARPLLLSWPDQGKGNEPDDSERRPFVGGVNRLWYSLAFVFLGIGLIALLAVAGKLNCANFPVVCSLSFRPSDDHNAVGRSFFRSALLFSLALLILVVLAWPVAVLSRNGPSVTAIVVDGFLILAGIGLLAAAIIDVFRARAKVELRYARRYWSMLGVGIGFIALWLLLWRHTFVSGPHHEGFFAAYRSADLVNGVAPTVPFGFLMLALLSWAWVQLKRLHMFHHAPHSVPPLGGRFVEGARSSQLVAQVDQVNDSVENPFSLPAFAYVTAVMAVVAIYFVMGEYTQGLELRSFDVAYGSAFSLMVLLLGLTCTRLVLIWARLRRVLHALEMHPIRDSFSVVPLSDEWGPILHRSIEGDRLERLRRELLSCSECAATEPVTDAQLEQVRDGILDPAWNSGKCEGASFKSASQLFALPYMLFIQATCRQMENLLVFLTAGFVLTLISLNSYPFQSEHVLSWFMANLLILIGLAVTFVLAGTERDPILSRMNGTTPGKIGKDFYMNLLSYGALPILTVLAAQFPAIGSFLFSWVQPLLQALRG